MTQQSQSASEGQPRLEPCAAAPERQGAIVKARLSAVRARPGLLSTLKYLGTRGGSALGDAYASLARSLLQQFERLEDLNAERRVGFPPKQRLTGTAVVRSTTTAE